MRTAQFLRLPQHRLRLEIKRLCKTDTEVAALAVKAAVADLTDMAEVVAAVAIAGDAAVEEPGRTTSTPRSAP